MSKLYLAGQIIGLIIAVALIISVAVAFLGIPAYLAVGFFMGKVGFQTAVVGLLAYILFYILIV